jgi:small subunit ribosomal protein S9
VWLKQRTGAITINKRPADDYLSKEADRLLIKQPLELTETTGKYDITVNVRGGGVSGQAGAIRHGISRALVELNPDLRLPLKKAAMLTRDSRAKERKKYGLRGARARYQYSKR